MSPPLTAVVSLVLVTHVAAVVVPVADPRGGDAAAVVTAELFCVTSPLHSSWGGGGGDESLNIKPKTNYWTCI